MQRPFVTVPDGHGELAIEHRGHFRAIHLIKVKEDLDFRIGGERVPPFLQRRAQFLIIENFAIKDGKDFAVFRNGWLCPRQQIDN